VSTVAGHARRVGMLSLLTRRYLTEYARRPLNLVLLAVVPVVFVTLSAGSFADFAKALGGSTDRGTIEAATAGWAASLLTGMAGFFHVTGSRNADRRLAAAGAGTLWVVLARLASALGLAVVASAGALVALALRTGIVDTPRVIGVTFLMALIYLGIGVTVGALVRSEINGSLVVVFVWMFDVLLGPAMGGTARIIRIFPLHFPTLVVTDVASGHAGPLGDLGISALWAAGALLTGIVALVATTRPAPLTAPRLHGRWHRILIALRYGFRDYRRNHVLWVLLVVLPIAFITLSIAVTPDTPAPVELVENGRRGLHILSMSNLHGAIMVPITVGFLAGLAGLFVALGSAEGDRRLVLAGYRPLDVLAARIGVIMFAALLTTGVALAVTGASFTPQSWLTFAAANALVALTYGMIGVLVGPRLGLLGGLYVMLALPFIDVGIAQNAMLHTASPSWGAFMPAHGAVRVLLDGAFTRTFDEYGALALALGWLVAVTTIAVAQFHRIATPHSG
jgi:ABC-type transport system involved in multi-copper enzyme maturation permease subunit